MIDNLRADLRYALRQMGRAPLTTVVASISVAIGIVVAVTAFSVLNAVMFKPLDLAGADDIYHVYTSDFDGRDEPYGSSSYADYQDFARSGAFGALAAGNWQEAAVSVAGSPPASEFLGFVSSNYFTILGLSPAVGRWFSAGDAEIIITYPYWKRRFGGDATVLGKVVQVNSAPLTVVGVAPESFRGVGLGPPMIGWAPASSLPAVMRDASALTNRGSRGFTVFGRLTGGTTEAAAASRLNALAAGLAQQQPGSWVDGNQETRLVSVLPHRQALLPPRNRSDMLLMIGAGLLLIAFVVLLACTNVAALLIGRAVGRQHEIAVRLTLGATRQRLLRQLLTESVLLAAIGGTIGFLGLLWTIRFVSTLPVVDLFDLRPDWRVLLVAVATSLTCAVVFGLAPALQSLRVDLRSGLGGTATDKHRNRLRGGLIALQVAASCVLILFAASAVRGVRAYATTDPGVDMDGLIALEIDTNVFGDDTARKAIYLGQVRELMAELPGVRSAASTTLVPLGDGFTGTTLELPDGTDHTIEFNMVGPNFFAMMGVPAIRGRVFDPTDRRGSAPVAVVNRAFLQRYGEQLVGQVVTVTDRPGIQIVGAVPEVSYHDTRLPAVPLIYLVDEQSPWSSSRQPFLMRVAPGAERAVAGALRAEIGQRFPDLVVPMIESMREHTARQTMPHRIAGRVALAVGGIELGLAAVGLYGLLLFALFARRREIGVRLALGASPREASWAVMRDGLRYAAFGTAGGVLLAIPAALLAEQMVPGARFSDPLPFVVVFSAALAAATLAAWVPARRAARVQPATALRYE